MDKAEDILIFTYVGMETKQVGVSINNVSAGRFGNQDIESSS